VGVFFTTRYLVQFRQMTVKEPLAKKKISVDWFFHGVLTKIGDTVDRFTGRGWKPTSSLAASELIERMKQMLDAESKPIPGKGIFVPHNIKLMLAWNKVSDDAEAGLKKLEFELLTAAIDHINDSLYYTFAPVTITVKVDYFVEGVKLYVSFDEFVEEDRDLALNLTIPAVDISKLIPTVAAPIIGETYIARFELNGVPKESRIEFPVSGSVSVGRIGSNALTIDDGSVSKIHASLSVDAEGHLLVADTGSTNGTFLNDERITYGKATMVGEGDRVKFGVIDVVFELVPRPVIVEAPMATEENASEAASGETIEIDGFEFKRGSSPPTPEIEDVLAATQASISPDTADIPEKTLRAIPIPTPSIGLSKTIRASAIMAENTATQKPTAVPIDGADESPIPPPATAPVQNQVEGGRPIPPVPIQTPVETAIPIPASVPMPKAVVLEPLKAPASSPDDEPETRYK
jgi:pSer/pThr/pTyr-binding forkhead associated (FHA) protein